MNKLANIADTLQNLFLYNINKFHNRDKNIWAFGEWFGEKCNDNSMMLANYIAENYHVTVYWVCKDSCDTSLLSNKINIVKMGSEKCKTVIHTAKVFVMNQNFHDFSRNGWNFYGGAITINLWHGVMWKRLGSSIEDKNALVKYYYHLYYKAHEAQYWVSVSDKYSDAIEEAFGVDKKNIINSGLPRNALFYNPIMLSEAKKRILSAIKKNNCIPENPYIISYMPTFRDEKDSLFDFNSFADDENFIEFLESNNVIIIQKAHFVSEHRTHETVSRKISRIINENEVSAQDLLASSDMLITDYSSCFFDYLLLDRPIIHFLYDYEYYKNHDRGLYYEWNQVNGGDVVFNKIDLLNAIIKNMEHPEKEKELRKKRVREFLSYENKDSCKEIADYIYKLATN